MQYSQDPDTDDGVPIPNHSDPVGPLHVQAAHDVRLKTAMETAMEAVEKARDRLDELNEDMQGLRLHPGLMTTGQEVSSFLSTVYPHQPVACSRSLLVPQRLFSEREQDLGWSLSDHGRSANESGLYILTPWPLDPLDPLHPLHPFSFFTPSPLHPLAASSLHPFTHWPLHRFIASPPHRLTR